MAQELDSQVSIRLPDGAIEEIDAVAVLLSQREGKPIKRSEAVRRALLIGIRVLSAPEQEVP